MDDLKFRPRVLGLPVLALAGLMVFMTPGAGATWSEKGAEIPSNKLLEFSLHSAKTRMVLPIVEIEVLCKKVEGVDFLLIAGTSEANGVINSEGCEMLREGKFIAGCPVVEPVKSSIKAKLILHNAKNYLLLSASVAGGAFFQIKFPESCPLLKTHIVRGSMVMECLTASSLEPVDCGKEEIAHLLRPSLELFPEDKLTYGVGVATLEWILKTKIASGAQWSGSI